MSQPSGNFRNVTKSYVSLGGNATSRQGNPKDTQEFALTRLSSDSVKLVQTSPFYATPAFPKGSGPDFVNAVAAVETSLSPQDFLALLHDIEADTGRVRTRRWGERGLDLDIISFGDAVLPDPETHLGWVNLSMERQRTTAPDKLIVPHPRVQDRAFVLVPLRDIAPNWTHPVTGIGINALIKALAADDVAAIKPLTP